MRQMIAPPLVSRRNRRPPRAERARPRCRPRRAAASALARHSAAGPSVAASSSAAAARERSPPTPREAPSRGGRRGSRGRRDEVPSVLTSVVLPSVVLQSVNPFPRTGARARERFGQAQGTRSARVVDVRLERRRLRLVGAGERQRVPPNLRQRRRRLRARGAGETRRRGRRRLKLDAPPPTSSATSAASRDRRLATSSPTPKHHRLERPERPERPSPPVRRPDRRRRLAPRGSSPRGSRALTALQGVPRAAHRRRARGASPGTRVRSLRQKRLRGVARADPAFIIEVGVR